MMSEKSNKTVLIVMAHGSRKSEANQEFEALARDIATQSHGYAAVKPCFLELATPKLADAVEACIGAGHTRFDVYPLFFNQGNHVTKDIPRQITQLQTQYPHCHFHCLEYFGLYKQLSQQVLVHIDQQRQ
ncbi:sirohydrochlorin chelatase [Eionea flava]